MLPGGEAVEEGAGRLDRVVGQPDRAGEDVGRAAGQGGERGVGAGQAVGRLVEGAVAAEHDDDVDAVAGRALGQAGGVVAAVGLGDGDVVVGRQRLLDDDPAARASPTTPTS